MQSSVDDSEMDLSGLGLQESLVDSDDEEVYNEHNEVSTGILYFIYFCMILLISFQVLSDMQYIVKLFTWVTLCYLSYSVVDFTHILQGFYQLYSKISYSQIPQNLRWHKIYMYIYIMYTYIYIYIYTSFLFMHKTAGYCIATQASGWE